VAACKRKTGTLLSTESAVSEGDVLPPGSVASGSRFLPRLITSDALAYFHVPSYSCCTGRLLSRAAPFTKAPSTGTALGWTTRW